MLGAVSATVDGREVRLGGTLQRALFAMLALAPGRIIATDRIVDGLWGDNPPGRPLSSIQVYVHGLRAAIAAAGGDRAVLASRAPGYLLDLTAADTDWGRFDLLRAESRERSRGGDAGAAAVLLARALDLWREEALADLRSVPFALPHTVRLDEARLLAREDLIDLRLTCGEHAMVVSEVESLVAEHPTRERLWGQLMTALYRSNRQVDALTAYARARDQLADELGMDPGEALRQLEIGILRHDPDLAGPVPLPASSAAATTGARDLPGATAPDSPPYAAGPPVQVHPRAELQVPRQTTPTLGRDELAAELVALLTTGGRRLVTLIGPGGTGKTRLATVVAQRAEDRVGTVFFLVAAEGQAAHRLLTDLLRVLGGKEPAEPTLRATAESVARSLPTQPVLVVLDNLEDVNDVGAAVAALLAAAPFVTVLATSRLPLRLPDEVEVVVPPLALPSVDESAAAAAGSPAVALFVERAGLVRRGFALDEDNVADVTALTRLLGGVPLAIELAAARMRLLTPRAAVERISHGFDLLSSTAGRVPERQRTIAMTVEWSLRHLSPSALDLLIDLSIFEDGFGLDAVEALPSVHAAAVGAPAPEGDPLDDLAALLEAGLVLPKDTRVELRYQVLGTVKSHLRTTRPRDPRVEEALRERQLAWLTEHATAWAADLNGPEGELVLGWFGDEHADTVTLVRWAQDRARPDDAAALAFASHGYWLQAGRIRQGCQLLAPLLERDDLSARRRDEVSVALATLSYHLGEHTRATDLCRAVLASDPVTTAVESTAHCYLGASLLASGVPQDAVPPATTALGLATQRGEATTRAVALSVLAIAAAMRGDFAAERAFYEERLAVVRAGGDRARLADTVNTLAEIALDEHDVESAEGHAAEALRLAGSRRPIERRDALITSARAAIQAGREDVARTLLVEAVAVAARTGQPIAVAQAARATACLLARSGEPAAAYRLFLAAHALSPSPTGGVEPMESDLREGLATCRAALTGGEVARLHQVQGSGSEQLPVVAALAGEELAALAARADGSPPLSLAT